MDNLVKKGTPKDVFLHLLAVLTLYVGVVAFITLWWQYINVLFPDLLQQGYTYTLASYTYGPIRWAMAALIIVFPIHILISWLIGREFKTDPEKREIRARKWLWYITLFISAATIIVDLITLVYNFLNGDLTIQFFLKIIVILIVSGAVFGYYLWDLKKRDMPSNKPKILAWITALIVLASIIYGFLLIGTPATQRARRFDEQRVNDLSMLQNQIINYWQAYGFLPVKLDSLKDQISGYIPPTDPETQAIYEYAPSGNLSFQLCANFKTSNAYTNSGALRGVPAPIGGYYAYQQNWSHDKGHVCFDRTIDPLIYKPTNILTPTIPIK